MSPWTARRRPAPSAEPLEGRTLFAATSPGIPVYFTEPGRYDWIASSGSGDAEVQEYALATPPMIQKLDRLGRLSTIVQLPAPASYAVTESPNPNGIGTLYSQSTPVPFIGDPDTAGGGMAAGVDGAGDFYYVTGQYEQSGVDYPGTALRVASLELNELRPDGTTVGLPCPANWNQMAFGKVWGIDVSHWQGHINNWPWVANSGISFVIVKALGGSTPDPQFVANMTGASSAGLVTGAYDYVNPNKLYANDNVPTLDKLTGEARDEADKFAAVAGPYLSVGSLQPLLDLDHDLSTDDDPQPGVSQVIAKGVVTPSGTPPITGFAALAQYARAWIGELIADMPALSLSPIIYVDKGYAAGLEGASPSLGIFKLWLADHRSPVPDPNPTLGPWGDWAIMQYADENSKPPPRVPGIGGSVDMDILNSDTTLDALEIAPGTATAGTQSITAPTGQVSAAGSLTITANVNASSAMDVLAGATLQAAGIAGQLRPADTAGAIELSSPSAATMLVGGQNSLPLTFNLPATLTPGAYELAVQLWQDTNRDGVIDSGDIQIGGASQPVQITVGPPSGLTAQNDSVSTTENTAVPIEILANDTDTAGTIDPTKVSIVAGPAHGSAAVDPTSGLVTYTPAANYAGPDSFAYLVKDSAGNASNIAQVAIMVTGPAAAISGNGSPILADAATPDAVTGTDMGTAAQGGTAPMQTFVIKNAGTDPLTIASVNVPTGFALVTSPGATVAPGGTTSFTIELDTGTVGIFYGDLTVSTNDPAAAPYTFAVSGTVNLVGDADEDGTVGFSDLLILAQDYGAQGATWQDGDFNGDGTVNFSDLLILAQNYGHSVPAPAGVTAAAAASSLEVPQLAGDTSRRSLAGAKRTSRTTAATADLLRGLLTKTHGEI